MTGSTGDFSGIPGLDIDINNNVDACVQATVPRECSGNSVVTDSTFMPFFGFEENNCPEAYDVTCTSYPDKTWDIAYTFAGSTFSCGTATLGVRTKTETDCELAIPTVDLPEGTGPAKTYRFTTGSFYESTGIEQDGCFQALLPSTCSGVPMGDAYVQVGGVEGPCDQTTYPATCQSIDNTAYENFGQCGTATFDVYLKSASDCTLAQNVASQAIAAAQAATSCTDADSVLESGMTCQDAFDQIGCNAAVATGCPTKCGNTDCNNANMLTLGLAVLVALLFAF